MEITISAYDAEWPAQFEAIKDELAQDLAEEGIPVLSIEHVGSTSVPGLVAKPIIDILIVIHSADFTMPRLQEVKDALGWGARQGGYHYIGDGGVKGRWSFKLYDVEPVRNVYVVAEGSLPLRSCLALRDTLRVNEGLREEYGRLKMGLARREYDNIMQYATLKNPVINKILREAGWSEADIDRKEGQFVKDWPREIEVLDFERSWWDCVSDHGAAVLKFCKRGYNWVTTCLTCFHGRYKGISAWEEYYCTEDLESGLEGLVID